MGVVDKILNAMKLNDNTQEAYYEENDYYDEAEADIQEFKSGRINSFEEPKNKKSTSKIAPIRSQKKSSIDGMDVCSIKPTSMEDAREITDTLLENRTVVLNLEGVDMEIAQRIIDFTSGSCYAIQGNLQKISHYIFIITPPSVNLSGEFSDAIGSSFGVTSLND